MQSIKDIEFLRNAGINHVGDRTCGDCNNTVPIYEVNGKEISTCMTCDSARLSKRETESYAPPKRRELFNRAKAIEYIQKDLEDVTFDDYVPKTKAQVEALSLTKEFVEGDHQSLLFQGDPGTGKSHLFRCAARELEKQKTEHEERDWQGNIIKYQVNKIVLFAKVPELMKLIQSTYNRYENKSGLDETTILETLSNADVLILDEIAGERSRSDGGFESWSSDIIYQILDHRQGKRNLYNTNYSSSEFKKKYGETQGKRILSRMASGAKILQVEGPDHRMKGLK